MLGGGRKKYVKGNEYMKNQLKTNQKEPLQQPLPAVENYTSSALKPVPLR